MQSVRKTHKEKEIGSVDEDRLIEKLRLVEGLFAGATTEGEKAAAVSAKQRILDRLSRWEQQAPPTEYKFSLGDPWSRKVFLALLRRYGIRQRSNSSTPT